MILSSFVYRAGTDWKLEPLSPLKPVTLLVGKNASGKTRTINALRYVASYLRMAPLSFFKDNSYAVQLAFTDPARPDWVMIYTFSVAYNNVAYEHLTVGGEVILERNEDYTKLKGIAINPPTDRLVIHVRRDRDAYPEFETLIEWAENVTAISCSNLNTFTSMNGASINSQASVINPISFSELVDSLSETDKEEVISSAKELGYDITSINTIQALSDFKVVAINENHVKGQLIDFQLSNGMLRVLYLLCFLSYIKHNKKCSMLLVDDLGEGLDYNRATLLGRKVFTACEKEGVQLIASSNDSFLMDVVDISNWQILKRSGSTVTVLNEATSPEMFDSFRMTGLSNFDFFSSDFIDNFRK